jgi:hypothetical protein
MFGSHTTWQLRRWRSPFTSTRHSKHVPIPQSGARGSPETDVLHAAPASKTATAAVDPLDTATRTPFTKTVKLSGMNLRSHLPRWQIRFHRNRSVTLQNVRADQFRRRQRSCDAQALMAGRNEKRWIVEQRPHKR